MSYATLDQFRAWVEGAQDGATRVANLLLATDAADQDELIQQALDAGAGEMDSGFRVAGYELPIDQQASDELDALLVKLNIGYALDQLAPGKPMQTQDGFHEGDPWHRKFVRRLRGGAGIDPVTGVPTFNGNPREVLPGLNRAPGNMPSWGGT